MLILSQMHRVYAVALRTIRTSWFVHRVCAVTCRLLDLYPLALIFFLTQTPQPLLAGLVLHCGAARCAGHPAVILHLRLHSFVIDTSVL